MLQARRKALLLAGVGAAAGLAGAFGGALFVQSRSGAPRLLSTEFADLQGRKRRLLEWQGRVIACNFWATWCAPCREEVPLLIAAKQQYAPRGFEVVGIAIDQVDKILEFANNYRINYPILVAGSEAIEVMRALGNRTGALPYTVVLDRSGRAVERRLGAYRKEELDQVLMHRLG